MNDRMSPPPGENGRELVGSEAAAAVSQAFNTVATKDPLEASLEQVLATRLRSGEWSVLAVAGDRALRPIAEFLQKQFGINDTTGVAIVVVRTSGSRL